VRRRELAIEELLLIVWREEQVSVEPLEITVNLLLFHNRFDLIDGGAVTLGREPRPALSMQALDFEVAIINGVAQVSGGDSGHATRDLAVVDDNNGFACFGEQVRGRKAGDACADDAGYLSRRPVREASSAAI